MRKFRLYSPTLAPHADTPFPLTEAMQHRLFTVLRVSADTEIELFDGHGHWQTAVIVPSQATSEAPNSKRARKVKKSTLMARTVTAPQKSEPIALTVHYGLALIKGERFDWALQKMTELGVTAITPLLCEHGEVKLAGERLTKKMNHWRAILIAAAEQCHLNWLPILHPPSTVADWCQTQAASTAADGSDTSSPEASCKKWILSPPRNAEDAAAPTHWAGSAPGPRQLAICSGPEGGFATQELQAASNAGFECLTLGPRVLRAETAPLVALGLGHWLWGDFQDTQI